MLILKSSSPINSNMDKDKIRVGVVGLGHRGRHMLKLAAEGFDCVVPAAACDIIEKNWYERQK